MVYLTANIFYQTLVIEIIAIYMQYQGQELVTFKKSWIGTKLTTCTKVFSWSWNAELLC